MLQYISSYNKITFVSFEYYDKVAKLSYNKLKWHAESLYIMYKITVNLHKPE
jgi:hypothetical protein